MDMKIIGSFLSQLRKEQGMTQEQLGEKLGVTNKTVSRWETGTYLPPVEMLQLLSEMYGITINEILSGERLSEQEYREKAEENIKTTLSSSAFTLKEKMDFFKRKWQKEHLFTTVLGWLMIAVGLVAGTIFDNGLQLLAIVAGFVFIIMRRNQMMSYVEDRAFDGSGRP
jgi:transcriptional regulator with XRE-family HTH domain